MESSHELKIALTKIRLMADIAQSAQCRNDEYALVMEMISDMADQVLDEEEATYPPSWFTTTKNSLEHRVIPFKQLCMHLVHDFAW